MLPKFGRILIFHMEVIVSVSPHDGWLASLFARGGASSRYANAPLAGETGKCISLIN